MTRQTSLQKAYQTRHKKLHHWTPCELHAVQVIWKANRIRMDRHGICKRIKYWFRTLENTPSDKAILAKIAICSTRSTW